MTIELFVVLTVLPIASAVAAYFVARSQSSAVQARNQQALEHLQSILSDARVELGTKAEALSRSVSAHQACETQFAAAKQQLASAQERLAAQSIELSRERERVEGLQRTLLAREQALASASAELMAAQKQIDAQASRVEELRADLEQQREKVGTTEMRRSALAEELAALRTSQAEKEQHFAEQLRQIAESKSLLKQEFENLANQIFEAKGRAFSEQNRQSLDSVLNPFRQQINDFKDRVESVYLEGTKQQTEMRSELKQLQSMHQKMSQEANELANALKGQKKMQGNWGELVLENVLDRSGLQLGKDYEREVSLLDEEGARRRPDVVVHLPQGKHLVIDSKVSLNAYARFVNADSDLERQQALSEHVAAVSARIKELADRNYYRLNGLNSPEMVFMFIPIESAFVEALKADEALFQRAIEQHVLVATPTTLLTSLNIVRQLWRFEDQNKHTAELARRAEGVFRKLRTFLGSFEGVKRGLEKAQEAYTRAENQLVSGPGNLVKQVSDFKQLAPVIKDQLPDYFVQKAELELCRHGCEEGMDVAAAEGLV